jgi:large subunit ribosomal protein L2
MRIVKPTTSGQRGIIYESRKDITTKKPAASLTRILKKTGGRDAFGHISTRHRGGGVKRKYRIIDFSSGKPNMEAIVKTIEYDPNRNVRIALIKYSDEEIRYILASVGLKVDDKIEFGEKVRIKNGNRMQIGHIPAGTIIHNIELQPGSKAKIVRSAGTGALIQSKDGDYVNVKLPSGEVRKIHILSYASIGQLSNVEHKAMQVGKAGRMRLMGRRPHVRGKAMNPNDHPHGGGEGHTSIGLKYPKTPWGKHALGVKTRKKKKPSSAFIVKGRK